MLSLARFSKMDLRPDYGETHTETGRMCEKSAVGMGRRGQWQSLRCSSWRNVQQGDCEVTSVVPLINEWSFPKPLREEEEKRCGKAFPCNGQIGSGYHTENSLGLKPGIHNEGKSGYMGSGQRIPCNGVFVSRRTLNLARKGSTGITAKSSTRHMCKEAPTLEERDEPGNLGSLVWNVKAPGSANVQTGRRSDRSSLSRLISGPYTKGCSKDRTPSTKHCRPETKPMNIGVVGRHGTEGEIPGGLCGEPRCWQTSTPGSGRRLGETALSTKRKSGVE
jgi:hypothetical protein